MAHVSLVERPRGLLVRMGFAYSRRKFGAVAEPAQVAAHHSGVMTGMGLLETTVERSWRRLDPHLRWLATQAAAGAIGCSWCTDFGYWMGHQEGFDPAKVRDVPRWRESDVYDERERVVLEFAEAATATPVDISPELVERLHAHFADDQIVELAAYVALESFPSRFNAGLGLRSQGFSDRCEVPLSAAGG